MRHTRSFENNFGTDTEQNIAELFSIIPLRGADEQLLRAVFELNAANASMLSDCSEDEFLELIDKAFFAGAAANGAAFLIAFDENAQYGSPNFQWFKERYRRFVYVDRVAVARNAQRHGLARLLYETLGEAARSAGHERLCCEVNERPPNPRSDAFHAALGFKQVGATEFSSGKAVRYLTKDLFRHK